MPSLAPDEVPLRVAPFSLPDQCLLWSKARLYADRITLSGWGFWERYWRQIPLEEIEGIQPRQGKCLLLHLENETDVSLLLSDADRWARSIRVHRKMHVRNG